MAYSIVILLAPPADHLYLRGLLDSFAPTLRILTATSPEGLLALPTPALRKARLIRFASPVEVPATVLKGLGYGAYGFHLGSADYPGWGSAARAHADRAERFGATAHTIADRPDGGDIVGFEFAHVPADITLPHLEELAYTAAARLFWRLAEPLAVNAAALPILPLTWRR